MGQGTMDAMYDEFGNYIGPELDDDDSDGVEGDEPDDVREHVPSSADGSRDGSRRHLG